MSAEQWRVERDEIDLPITALVFDSETGETPIIFINEARPRRSILKVIKALRRRRKNLLILPDLHILTDIVRRVISDCPITVSAAAAVIGGGGVILAAPPAPAPPPPAVVQAAPAPDRPPLAPVAHPSAPAQGRPHSGSTAISSPSTLPSLRPTASQQAAVGAPRRTPDPPRQASPHPSFTRTPDRPRPTPESSPSPTPSESPTAQPTATEKPPLLEVDISLPHVKVTVKL